VGFYAALKRRYRNPWLFAVGLVFFHLLMLGAWKHKLWMLMAGGGGLLGCWLSYPDPPKDAPSRPEPPGGPGVRAGLMVFSFLILVTGLWAHNQVLVLASLALLVGYRVAARRVARRAAAPGPGPDSTPDSAPDSTGND
jgi:hypothetical protein